MRANPRLVTLVVAGALVVSAPVLGTSSPAQAHNYLVSSTPTAGATLTDLPPVFVVTTNGPLLTIAGSTSGFALEVRDDAGAYYGDGCVTVDGASVTTTAALGAAGDYTMLWQVVSTDGHSVSGEVEFTWAPGADFVPSAGADAQPDCNGTVNVTSPDPGTPDVTDLRSSTVDLADVLWIGGAIAAVLVAGLVTLLVVSRRRKDRPTKEKS